MPEQAAEPHQLRRPADGWAADGWAVDGWAVDGWAIRARRYGLDGAGGYRELDCPVERLVAGDPPPARPDVPPGPTSRPTLRREPARLSAR